MAVVIRVKNGPDELFVIFHGFIYLSLLRSKYISEKYRSKKSVATVVMELKERGCPSLSQIDVKSKNRKCYTLYSSQGVRSACPGRAIAFLKRCIIRKVCQH